MTLERPVVSIVLYDCYNSFPQYPESGYRLEYLGVGLKEQSLKDCQAVWEMAPKFAQQLKSFLHLRVASIALKSNCPPCPQLSFILPISLFFLLPFQAWDRHILIPYICIIFYNLKEFL